MIRCIGIKGVQYVTAKRSTGLFWRTALVLMSVHPPTTHHQRARLSAQTFFFCREENFFYQSMGMGKTTGYESSVLPRPIRNLARQSCPPPLRDVIRRQSNGYRSVHGWKGHSRYQFDHAYLMRLITSSPRLQATRQLLISHTATCMTISAEG